MISKWSVDCCDGCLLRLNCHARGCIYDDIAHINLRGPLTEREHRVMLLFSALEGAPIPSMHHLAAEVFLVENVLFKNYYNLPRSDKQ